MLAMNKIALTLLFVAHNVRPFVVQLTPCPNIQQKNYNRYEVLEKIKYKVLPAAMRLKNITGARIYRFKQDLYQQAPYIGFPNISSRGENCSICKINNCFNDDCQPLGKLIRFLNKEISSEFADIISKISTNIERLRQQMNCADVSASFNSTIATKEKDYRIAKDLVFILKTLKNKYNELD